MAEEMEPPGRLEKEEALELARQGKDAWNAWAKKHSGWDVDFSGYDFSDETISFAYFTFPGSTDFSRCTFKDISFLSVVFAGRVNFSRAQFFGNVALFRLVLFSGPAEFNVAKFHAGSTDFRFAAFDGADASFHRAQFNGQYSNFRDTNFRGGQAYFQEVQFTKGIAIFRDAQFYMGAFFNGATFSEGANFQSANFKGWHTDFSHAKFGEDAIFSGSQFANGNADFPNTHYSMDAWFSDVNFKQDVDFSAATFDQALYMQNSIFEHVPDFRYTELGRHLTLQNVYVGFAVREKRTGWMGAFTQAKNRNDSDKFRRLKELAIYAKDHDRELDFFAKELMGKRFYEIFGTDLIWSYLYGWFSNFGRSTWRPLIAIVAVWFVWGVGFWVSAQFNAAGPLKSVWDGLKLSASVLVPFVATARTSYSEAKAALFDGPTSFFLDIFVITEGILGLAFVFLIGLALRNRFRI